MTLTILNNEILLSNNIKANLISKRNNKTKTYYQGM